jgi:hypothetical protein
MKKILFLLACTFLVGCCASGETPDPIKIGENSTRAFVRPYHFEYNGHQYIYFLGSATYIVHNPDCSCCKEESTLW